MPDLITFVLAALNRLEPKDRLGSENFCVHWDWQPGDTEPYAAAYPIGLKYEKRVSNDRQFDKHRCAFVMGER